MCMCRCVLQGYEYASVNENLVLKRAQPEIT